MKLSIPAVCWECRQPMVAGEFYMLTRTPEGTWQPHHEVLPNGRPCIASTLPAAPQGVAAQDTGAPAPSGSRPVSVRMEGHFATVHVTRTSKEGTVVELVWPCPPDMVGLKLVELLSNLGAVSKMVAP